MGVINKINEKAGVITGAIVIALILFILGGDLLRPNSFFSRNQNVGEIAGEDISYQEYESVKEDLSRNKSSASDNDMFQIHQQAWTQLIFKYAYSKQYEKLGLTVSEDELEDMISGKNIPEWIKNEKIFQDPMTMQFDRAKYDQWRKSEQGAQYIDILRKQIADDRLSNKYTNLFQNAVYVTKEEAKKEYYGQNAKAEVRYLWVPYYSVPDSAVKVTDEDIEDYISRHKSQYKNMEARRSIMYVTFPVQAAGKDTSDAADEVTQLKKEFETTDDDSLFVASSSDTKQAPSVMTLDQLPADLQKNLDSLKKGSVYGPFLENGKYKLYKALDVIQDPKDTIYYASTKHILFMTRDKSKEQKDSIRKKAEEVLAQLKKGANFEEMVMKYTEDPGSKSTGGEYKWFPKGRMVKPFEEAVFTAKSPGLVPKLVETEYGYHILKVTDTKTNKKVKVATIEKEIIISAGRDKAFQKASDFYAAINDKDTAAFTARAKQDSLQLMTYKSLKANDMYVNNLTNPRELIRWAFNEADEGEASPVLPVGDQYVVAILVSAKDKGMADAEDVRDEVKPKVINEKKAQLIIEKLEKASGTLEKKSQAYGPGATVGTATDVLLQSSSMQGVGFEPEIVGTVFGLVPGKRTIPMKGDNGVAVLELIKITEVKEIADYTNVKTSLVQQRKGNIMSDIDNAIREDAEIEDNRVKFY
ncbi:MAG: peptidylprolyl isomerase [Cytophagaceae bacterium]|nr:peptidylprolyl isomerase [Cytophagaceae bacterium]